MRKRIDLTGKRFGRLTVLEPTTRKTVARTTQWLCECDCGKKVIVRCDNLNSGRTTKCSRCRNNSGRQSVFFFEPEPERDDDDERIV